MLLPNSKTLSDEEFPMTDPAVAIKDQINNLIQMQIFTLRKSSSIVPAELVEYHERSVKISVLFSELDRSKPLPSYPVRRRRSSRLLSSVAKGR
jgi:hypothetical protein